MRKVIRVGILGQGRSGRDIHGNHLIKALGQYKIVAVADPLPERCDRATKEYGCAACTDYRDVLKRGDLDLVVNALPSHLHVPVSLEALKAGHRVLCEKPLARTVKEVDRLIAAAKKAKKVLAIYQQRRYESGFLQIRKVLGSGVLGRIVMIKMMSNGFARRWDWQTLRENMGGALLNTGPHILDQALQFFGTDAMPKVMCIMDRCNTFGDAEDHVKLILTGKDRPTLDIEISSCCTYPPAESYNVYGTRGGLSGNANRLVWKYFKEEEAPKRELIREPLKNQEGLPIYCSETLTWHEESWEPPEEVRKDVGGFLVRAFYDGLYQTLVSGAELTVKPEEIRQQIAVIDECLRQNPKL